MTGEAVSAPEVTVLITTYNRMAVLPAAIDAALGQTLAPAEVIVVDDGSTDGTAREIRRAYAHDPRVRVLTRPNGGPPAARNTGVENARGEWIALLDSDDWWEPGYLESQAAVLAQHRDADMVLCNGRRQDQTGQWHLLFDHPLFTMPTSIEAMCAGTWIQPSFTVVSAEAARKLRFDERFRIADDLDFMWRFLGAGYRCVGNPEPLAEYRAVSAGGTDTEEQLTADFDRMMLGAYTVWRHHSARHPLVLRRGPSFDREMGGMLLRHGRAAEARAHLWRWWRARPWDPRAARALLAALGSARP
jgi:glycosyltransferase involved in cell wall biosynthesis